ncbi:MAG TPA: type II secretion system protein GspF, partial [Candidatus Hydrogenedentes bacterium]|nr:type II secretion system protein GspF [Candidatus Hydrogenedentota bacterium]
MARFKYRALDAQENPVEGVMDAASAREAVLLLQDQGLKAPSVERMDSGRRLFTKRGALTWSDLEQLNNQLALIVRGGLPLAPSLDSMARDLR